jgi:hypothetical protein
VSAVLCAFLAHVLYRGPIRWYWVERSRLIQQLETIGGPQLQVKAPHAKPFDHSAICQLVQVSAPFPLTVDGDKVTGGGLEMFVTFPLAQGASPARQFDLVLSSYDLTPELISSAHWPSQQQRVREGLTARSIMFGGGTVNGRPIKAVIDKTVHIRGPRSEVLIASGEKTIHAVVADRDRKACLDVLIRRNDVAREVAERIAERLEIALPPQ